WQAGEDVVEVPEPEEDETAAELSSAEELLDGTDPFDVIRRRLAGERPTRSAGRRKLAAAAKSGRRKSAPSLRELSKSALYERAQQLDLPGRSTMSKEQLVE